MVTGDDQREGCKAVVWKGITMKTEQDLQHAQSLVRDSEEQVDSQQQAIELLRSNGQPTRAADRFMSRLRDTLQARRDHRDAVANQINSAKLGNEA
jgi:hypothetical protein